MNEFTPATINVTGVNFVFRIAKTALYDDEFSASLFVELSTSLFVELSAFTTTNLSQIGLLIPILVIVVEILATHCPDESIVVSSRC